MWIESIRIFIKKFSEREANLGGASIEDQRESSSLLETYIERNESAAEG